LQTHAPLVHVSPLTVQSLPHVPQFIESDLRFTHAPLQTLKPTLHCDAHAVPTHAQCEFTGNVPLHPLQPPLQQMPPVHDVPSVTFANPPHVCVPLAHDDVPT
jgi:hypothetical protein